MRTIHHSAIEREVEQNVHIPNQLNVQSGTMPRCKTSRTTSPEAVIIPPPSNKQVEEQGVHAIEMESTLLNIEAGMQRDDMGMNRADNVSVIQTSGNAIPPIGVGESTPSLNVHPESHKTILILQEAPMLRMQEIDL